ncbi:hypothetical protein CHS0354_029164 [Potamilus streckersoni]|uniref:Uncharacterized protein n=1 Tax=Potamilus streckersoni TaxID=2493646 RepID=A0AAE0T1L3_9BIVA|nr:hypothetical protein CHS0354_029164 [Potamilus streckersoni]
MSRIKRPPQDLLCRWCSQFVGVDRRFCSIFCESRFSRSKRRRVPHANRETMSADRVYESNARGYEYEIRKDNRYSEEPAVFTSDLDPLFSERYLEDYIYCQYCTRPLVKRGSKYCDKACERRYRTLNWKIDNLEQKPEDTGKFKSFQVIERNIFPDQMRPPYVPSWRV